MATLGRGLYDIQDVLGKGRWSTVYRCFDPQRDERVAIKVLALASGDPLVLREMYNREVRALEGFEHPHVIGLKRAHDFFDKGELLLVLDLVDRGQTLDGLLDGTAVDWPLDWRLQQALGVLDALDHAHQRGIVHRDLKPANLLVDLNQRLVRVSDFGIAQIAAHYARGDASTTLRSFYSRPFAAPEQRLEEYSTPASDLYGFAWLLGAMLLWRRVNADDTPAGLLGEIRTNADLAAGLGALLDPLAGLVNALLADDSAARPRLAEVRQVLQLALAALTPVQRVPIALTTKARQRMVEFGWKTPLAALQDLNKRLKVRFDPGKEGKPDSVRCFGERGVARLSFDPNNHELVMTDWYDAEPDKMAQDTDRLQRASFFLFEGRGDGQPLLDHAAAEDRRALADRTGLQARREFTGLANTVLDIQRETMGELWARYEIIDETRPRELEPWQQKLAAQGGHTSSANLNAQGEIVRVKLLKAWPKLLDAEPSDDDPTPKVGDWIWEVLQHEGATYDISVDKMSIGSLYGLEPLDHEIRIKSRRGPSLPRKGILKLYDKQLDVALKRQGSALGCFDSESAVNPNLAERLLAPESNGFEPQPPVEPVQEKLATDNETLELIRRALAARDMYFLQGPPGTGKTTFIVETVAQILKAKPDARILVTSQSNEAVDNAVERLYTLRGSLQTDWRIVRDRARKDDQPLRPDSFDQIFQNWAEQVKERSSQNESKVLEACKGPVDNTAALKALDNWRAKVAKLPDVKKDFAASVHVWAMTLLRVPTLEDLLEDDVEFDYVIVDEAGRATVAEVLCALIRGRRFLLVGDHRQLPPFLDGETKRSLRARGKSDIDASISLFENLFEKLNETNRGVMRKQFRMHPSIAKLIADLYYRDIGLQSGVPHEDRPLALDKFKGEQRVWWCDVAGGEKQFPGSTSWWNDKEARAIEKMLLQFDAELIEKAKKGEVTNYTVGIIATYSDQKYHLRKVLERKGKNDWKHLKLRIETVDAFQGKEEDIILYSVVRGGSPNAQFIADVHRLNVAFSRAKSLLVIVGDRNIAGHHQAWADVVNAIPANNFFTVEGGL